MSNLYVMHQFGCIFCYGAIAINNWNYLVMWSNFWHLGGLCWWSLFHMKIYIFPSNINFDAFFFTTLDTDIFAIKIGFYLLSETYFSLSSQVRSKYIRCNIFQIQINKKYWILIRVNYKVLGLKNYDKMRIKDTKSQCFPIWKLCNLRTIIDDRRNANIQFWNILKVRLVTQGNIVVLCTFD